ncbi:MAG: hypothetical protein ACJ8FY_00385 [Gemmataceae bacterium]
MAPSLKALLSGAIDYAGMFPPAKLSLEEAFRNYLGYRESADAWMLGRFVCPVAKLGELDCFIRDAPKTLALAVSCIGTGGATRWEFASNLLADLVAIRSFNGHVGKRGGVDSFEVKLPTDLVLSKRNLWDFSSDPRFVYRGLMQWLRELSVFCETDRSSNWRATLPTAITFLEGHWKRINGFKFRCGGLEAAAFPSPDEVAYALLACAQAGVAIKFTAGLHHAIRHYDGTVQTKMHGFLNVLVAGVLAYSQKQDEDLLSAVLGDENPEHFQPGETGLRWKDHYVTIEEITDARQKGGLSFGSCSFDEPRDDLRKLGWLL